MKINESLDDVKMIQKCWINSRICYFPIILHHQSKQNFIKRYILSQQQPLIWLNKFSLFSFRSKNLFPFFSVFKITHHHHLSLKTFLPIVFLKIPLQYENSLVSVNENEKDLSQMFIYRHVLLWPTLEIFNHVPSFNHNHESCNFNF